MEALLLGELTMIDIIKLNVSDYSKDPFGRYLSDGEGNGEEYRKKFLVPELKKGNSLIINLDGINDEYGSSFLVEAFANLIRKEGFEYNDIKNRVKFVSENKDWLEEIDYYLEEVKKENQGKILLKNF
jgi:hypothetical protein